MAAGRVAIVGVTGAVGQEFLRILETRNTPHCQRVMPPGKVHGVEGGRELVVMASARSAGQTVMFRGVPVTVQEARADAFDGVELAYFAVGAEQARELAPAAARAGAVVIDNSSAFRMDPDVPLVTPEVNPGHVSRAWVELARREGRSIIANPNCSTIILLVAVTPIHRAFGIRRLVVSTYQAVSGAGQPGLDALEREVRDVASGGPARATYFPEPCAMNLFLHESKLDGSTGRTVEEQKMIDETRKMWGQAYGGTMASPTVPAFGGLVPVRAGIEPVRVAATCVRVGVRRAHSESVNIELVEAARLDEVRAVLATAPGVRMVDDWSRQDFPTPLKADGGDAVLVGRVRGDESLGMEYSSPVDGGVRYRGLDLFCSGDQIRKGAALNAVQIGELVA